MNNFLVLLKGELVRMKKYNILAASFLVSLIWIGVLHFSELDEISTLFPLLIFLDATAMSMLMVGVTMFFEKQEGTIKALLVSPVSKTQYILAKTASNITSNITTLAILYLYARIFKVIDINIAGLFLAVILIAFFHSLIGFVLMYYTRDFTELLMGMLKFNFIFMIPVLLEQVGIIKNELVSKILFIIPTKVSMVLLNATAAPTDIWKIYFSIVYLLVVSLLLYLVVYKKFDEFAIKESGV